MLVIKKEPSPNRETVEQTGWFQSNGSPTTQEKLQAMKLELGSEAVQGSSTLDRLEAVKANLNSSSASQPSTAMQHKLQALRQGLQHIPEF